MRLDLLSDRSAGAAENMATDFMLLQRYPSDGYARFRHYGWHRPAYTFGYSQKINFVREQLPPDIAVELCRRPTGGGVVDHRADWTYALVIPRAHPAYDARALESYRLVHASIADVLQTLGQPATLKDHCEADPKAPSVCSPGVCFTRAELNDVIRSDTGHKIAGAAQKRNKHGLLFQGSIARETLAAGLDWDEFHQAFVVRLAEALNISAVETPSPDWSEDELSALVEQYSSPEWNEFR